MSSQIQKQIQNISCIFFVVLFSVFSTVTFQTALAADAILDNILHIGGAEIEVYFGDGVAEGAYNLNRKQVIAWIESSAQAVSDYFLKFPVKKLRMSIDDGARNRVNGTAYHGKHPLIIINIRESFTIATLKRDWVMVHEMVHLSFPPVNQRHNWLLEGLATYVEPIVRVRAGLLKEDEAWKWLIKGTPQGLPEAGNKGLDNTPTWGQKYWGGAIFFLLADLRIHQETNNKYGIEHALHAIQRNGGSMQSETIWSVNKALAIGDKATGTKVLMTLYNDMKDKAVTTDLNAIWNDLGVSLVGDTITYRGAIKGKNNGTAPKAKLRESIYNQ